MDLYEFKIDLFDNGDPEEFLLLFRNLNTNIEASGTLETAEKVQYLCTLVCREALRQFDTLSSDVEIGTPLTAETIILGLGAYFLPVNSLYNQKPAMQRGTRKPHGLKVRLYVACLIDFNKYLD